MRREFCRRGHRIAGSNEVFAAGGSRRMCRRCFVAREARYEKARRDRLIAAGRLPRSASYEERFKDKIAVDEQTGCWAWRGYVSPDGYGRFAYHGEQSAHRAAYRMYVGPIPAGMIVLHRCDRRACVNPDHLTLGRSVDNTRDAITKGRMPCAKLSADLAAEIREMHASGQYRVIELARVFGLTPEYIRTVLREEVWKERSRFDQSSSAEVN